MHRYSSFIADDYQYLYTFLQEKYINELKIYRCMVKVGVIGSGKWGENHLRGYAELKEFECQLVGLADIDAAKKTLAESYGILFFQDFKQLLPLVDAVSIVVPTTLHYTIVKECLAAGKHVLVEKPITLHADQARELVNLAREKNLLLSVGYLFRFNPSVIALKELLKKGSLGKIQYIQSRYIHSSKPPRSDSGVIFNLGIHMIDILNYILEQFPKKVYCKKINFLDHQHEDSAVIILDYGHFFAEIEVSCCHPFKKRDLWLIADKKKIYADFLEQTVNVFPLMIQQGSVIKEPEETLELHKNEPLKEELKYFITVVKKHKKNNGDYQQIVNIGEEEYYTTKICELALQSAHFKRDLDIE